MRRVRNVDTVLLGVLSKLPLDDLFPLNGEEIAIISNQLPYFRVDLGFEEIPECLVEQHSTTEFTFSASE